jgi:putative transcriptional regulator
LSIDFFINGDCMSEPQPEKGPLTGHFLIAMPSLDDPNFSQTITYMCVHNQEGAFGLVVNRPLSGGRAKTLFKELGLEHEPSIGEVPIHIGGPVHPGHVFILHGPPFDWNATLMVSDTVGMTNSLDILEAICKGKGPEQFLLILGCAGWAPGQLEDEILENSWLHCPADDEILFEEDDDKKWDKATRSLGIDPALLSHSPGHA